MATHEEDVCRVICEYVGQVNKKLRGECGFAIKQERWIVAMESDSIDVATLDNKRNLNEQKNWFVMFTWQ